MEFGDVGTGSVCDQHMTVEEDRLEDEAIAQFRATILPSPSRIQ